MSAPVWMTLARVLIMAFAMVAIVWLAVWLLGAVFGAIGWVFGAVGTVFGRLFGFIGAELRDLFASIGGVVSSTVYLVMILVNGVLGRPKTVAFYARALENEVGSLGRALYAVTFGNLARALGWRVASLNGRAIDLGRGAAAGARWDARPRRAHAFDGYRIVGDLPAGGSGAQLFIAEPEAAKASQLAAAGHPAQKVVIKVFSARDGSTLPQIVRESRALEAARRLGLVLDHALEDDRFYYVMPFVPGDDLDRVTEAMHAASGEAGLDGPHLQRALRYTDSLLVTLASFHAQGLWHKDVKPSNIIVSDPDDAAASRAHLVDLGLLTPLRSTLTLTTHGTEYFRDPELVRMAMRGVKVSDVPGAKFDVYGAGAVLYAMLESSFPAHGGLSQISKRCPEAVRWIVRRAMTDLHSRYETADDMLLDVRAVLAAADPFAVRPADLPSMNAKARKAIERTWAHAAAQQATASADPSLAASAGTPAAARAARGRNPFTALLRAAMLMIGLGVAGVTAAVVLFAIRPARDGGVTTVELLPAGAPRAFTVGDRGLVEVSAPARRATAAPARRDDSAKAPRAPTASVARLPGALVRYDTTTIRFDGAVPRSQAPRGVGDRGTILVVDDLPADASAARQQVVRVLGELERSDFTVRGLGDLPSELLLVAQARNEIGPGLRPEDVGAAQRLAEALHTRLPPTVDAILWVGRGARGDEPASLLVGHRDFAQLPIVAQVLEGR